MEENLFTGSPFALVASPDVAACWAGRKEVLENLQRIQSSYERRSDSSLEVMWANLGAGKSHVLFHLAHRLQSGSDAKGARSVPVIIEMPEKVRSFHDLYRRIVSAMPVDVVAFALTSLPAGTAGDLKQAGQVLMHGSADDRKVAWEWLTGGRPLIPDLRRVTGIGRRIEDDGAATDTLSSILAALAKQKIRLVLLVDEFQRVGVLKKEARDTLLSSLRSVFSRTPNYLSVMLASALRMERNALDLLSPELRTLLGRRPTLSLPEMSEAEALEFVRGRFQFFRPAGFSGDAFAPFSEDDVAGAIDVLKSKGRPLIPREILQALAYCYDESFGAAGSIGGAGCRRILEGLRWEEE